MRSRCIIKTVFGNDLVVIDEQKWWAVGNRGAIVHYQADEWQPVPSPTETNLEAIVMLSSDEGWAVGWDGTILHYIQNEWQLVPNSVSQNLYGLDMVNENEGWAVGDGILHYTNQ